MKAKSAKQSWIKSLSDFAVSSKETVVISTEIVIGLTLCFLSLLFFLYITEEMLEADFNLFDTQVSQYIYSLRSPNLTHAMMEITSLGSGVNIFVTSLVGIIFLIKKHKKESLVFSLALIIGILINSLLKMLIQRPRPLLDPLVVERMSSFPSGHAMNAFIFFCLLSYFSNHFFKNKHITIAVSLFSAVCILLVGFSRVYLGVHYPTDVLAGYVAGFWWFITVLLIEHTLVFYKLFKKSE